MTPGPRSPIAWRSAPLVIFAMALLILGVGFVVSAQFNTLGSPAAVSGPVPPITPFWVSEISLDAK